MAKTAYVPRVQKPQFDAFKLDLIELIECNLDRSPPEEHILERTKSSFTCAIVHFFKNDTSVIFFSEYQARAVGNEEVSDKLTATYVTALELGTTDIADDVVTDICVHFARTVTWTKFRDLLGFMVVQSDLPISRPPSALKEVIWNAKRSTKRSKSVRRTKPQVK